jgi:hypothetical protein
MAMAMRSRAPSRRRGPSPSPSVDTTEPCIRLTPAPTVRKHDAGGLDARRATASVLGCLKGPRPRPEHQDVPEWLQGPAQGDARTIRKLLIPMECVLGSESVVRHRLRAGVTACGDRPDSGLPAQVRLPMGGLSWHLTYCCINLLSRAGTTNQLPVSPELVIDTVDQLPTMY